METIDTGTDSLTCTYDEETNSICFDWDAEANPEYNYLLDITTEELVQKMIRWSISDDAATEDNIDG